MLWFFLPVLIVVASNVLYDVSSKSIRADLNVYAGTTIIYSILALVYFLLFKALNPAGSLGAELVQINWALVTFALASIGLESGYILLFRAGWSLSLGGMVCNILLSVSMLFVGQMFFSETVTLRQYLGVLLCMAGLITVFRAGDNTAAAEEEEKMPRELA